MRFPSLTCLLFALPLSAGAQTPPPAPPLDSNLRREIVDTLAAELERLYVDADTGRLIATRLRSRLAAKAYDRFTEASDFADALAQDLRAVNGDLHLGVRYAPDFPAAPLGTVSFATPKPVPPGTPPSPDEPPPTPAMVAEFRASNFGLERAEVLEGNIGYLQVHGFYQLPEAFAATGAALGFLERTEAMIFDLREMPGGSGDMSNWIISHFTGTDSVATLKVTNRSAGDSAVRWTLAKVPGGKRPEVPVFVLVSGGTASAGEDFAFVLQNLHRATLVGETTAGAGHNNEFVAVGYGLVASIAYTRVMDPRTGREWERVGVRPDVMVPSDQALNAAHALALRALAAGATDGERKHTLQLTAETMEAESQQHRVPARLLSRYAGTYGERTLTLRDGKLYFRRKPNPEHVLVPINDSTFALGTVERVRIERARSGKPRLRLIREAGDTVVADRSGP